MLNPHVNEAYFHPPHVLLFHLATYRVANIAANELVKRVVRAPFIDVEERDDGAKEVLKPEGIRKTISTLFNCPSCIRVWSETFITYWSTYFPSLALIIAVLFSLSAWEKTVAVGIEHFE